MKKRKLGRKLLSWLLTLAMVVGLMPGMSMTAQAAGEKAYAAYDVTTETNKTKRGDDLTALQVTFNGKKWYIIEDNSSSATSGTVTLLSADTSFGTKTFDDANNSNKYSTSQVKAYLDGMTGTGGAFADVADAIETVDLTTNKNNSTDVYETVNGVKLYLLSTEEANSLPANVRKAEFTGGDCEFNEWWLRSPGVTGENAAIVYGDDGYVDDSGYPVNNEFGVRPALKLNLSSVIFSSESNAFSLKPADNTVTWSDLSDISIGEWESVTEDGVTVTLGSRSRFKYGNLNLGSCLFMASQGGISGITIQTEDDLYEPYGGWPSGWIADGKTLTWSGDPAVEVSLEGRFLQIYSIQQITFTMSDTGTGTKTVWTNETIEIDGEVTVNRRILVNGNVTLNLKEGSKLIANAGINVSAGNSLTIQGSGELIASIDEQQSLQADHDMAAIGGNDEQDAGTITITGGTIEAHGGANAAGIGGGDHGNGGTVNISGGTVTAIGGSFGAGIGGGNGKNGGTVNISGGTVIATGGQYGSNGGSSSGIGKNGYGSDDGTLTLGDGVLMQVSSDNTTWSEYNGSDRARYMKSYIPTIDILVTGLTLDKTTTQIIDEGNKVSFTATVSPDNASDKTVKWSVGGTNATAVKLYSDENCTTEVGTDATETLTVYAKGISAGSATVTCTSNADSTKSASCAVTVTDPLADVKTSAKADLDTLLTEKNQNDYDAADWTTLTQAITDGKTAIDNATTTEAITTAKNNAVDAVNAVKTKAQKALDNAKTTAKNDLDTLLTEKNQNDYDAADWTTLTQAITDGKTAIDNATTTEAVTTAKNNAVDAVNAVKTKAQKELEIAIDTVSELPSADAVTLDDKEAIEEARAAYDALTDEQKAELDDSVLEKLEACEDAFTTIVSDAILIIDEISEENIEDIRELLDFYDELSDAEKDNVDEKLGREGKKKLSDVESVINAVDKIEDIPLIEEIDVSDEKAITLARTAYELLSESEKALVSGDVIEKLEAAEAKIEELKNNEALNAAKASAIGRLEDYVDAKALSDATQDEDKAIKDVVDAEIEKINAAADMDAVAKALTAAKAAVDAVLADIKQEREDAAAAKAEMAEADDALETAKENAESAIKAADEAAADEYASGTDKKAISDAKDAVENAVNAAEALSDTASATAKKAAAKAIEDAVAALNEAVDKATVNSDAARAKAEEEADAAAQLEAAKDSAIDRLNDYSEAKALADATDTEKEAYNKAVTDGKTAIEAATTIEAVAAALANAKAAVDAALAKIAEDRAAAAAAAQEMAEADEAVADALVYADVSKADAVEAAADEYASNADKQDIATAMATLEGAINAAKQLAADASAETKREAAQAVMNAAAALDQVVDAAKVRSAAAKAAATELAAARASACERLDDYSEAKALADATDAEKEAYNKAVTDGKTAINAAATTEAVAEALKAAKAAVDAALAKIAEDRAAAAEAAAEMEEADESLELARTIAGLAKAEAEKAANDEYASDTDKNAITTAKATLEGAINAAAQLAADASAEAKRAAAQTIVNAANALYDVCETAERNSAAAKADAEAAAAAAAALAAAREYACERLDDFTDAKALDDATEAEQKEYDDVIAAEKEKINAAADQAAIDEALKAAKAAVNAELAKIKDDRTKAAAVVEMISGLPATEEIVLDDKEAVEAARTAYDALTDDQKLKVSDEVVKTLEDAEDMVVIRQVKSEIIARTGMIYNGQAFQLIDTPETDLPDGFTMMYAVTTENVEPDALEYAEDIPEAVEFGNYYVWFKVVDEQDNIWGGVSSVEVTIIRPTEIVTQPAAAKVIRGSKAKFSVEATGDDLTYVWQISKDGVNWSNSTASGCDTDKITFRATKALNGRYYRCVITGAGGVVISDAVKITTLAVINGQPGDAAATIGSDVTFSVSSRSSAATYQWQVSTDGGETWKKSSAEGCDTEHLTVNVKSAKYGEYLFRCKVTNGTWVEYSKAAGIDIVTFIVKQPETIFASEGDKVKLYVKATGIAPTYQWEVMTGAGNWVNSTAPGNATNIITFKATAEKTAYKWRCKITDGDTVLYSDVVTLVIESGQYED